MKYFIYIICLALLSNACNNKTKDNHSAHDELNHTHDHDHERSVHEEDTDEHSAVETTQLVADTQELIIECMGKILVPPQSNLHVNTAIDAHIYQLSVLPGSLVKKGQILAYLRHRNIISLQTKYISLFYKLGSLKADFERKKQLSESNGVAAKDFEAANALYKQEEAHLDGLAKELKIVGINAASLIEKGVQEHVILYAPFTGVVQEVFVHEGSFVAKNMPILTLIDSKRLHLDLDIFARDAHLVKPGHEVSFSVPGIEEQFHTKIHLLAAALNPNTNTLHAQAEINALELPLLKPGMVVNAQISAGEKVRYFLNELAIQFENGQPFIILNNNERVKVQLGIHFNGKYQINNALALVDRQILIPKRETISTHQH